MSFKEIPVALPELQALYRSLGEEKIRAIVDKFYIAMEKDVLVGFFFNGKDLKQIAAKQTDFLLRAMGGRPSYTGLAPADAHEKLPPILSGHFDRRLKILEETLTKAGLSDAQRRAWIGFENAFRDAIVASSRIDSAPGVD